jgi:hypothetical protein
MSVFRDLVASRNSQTEVPRSTVTILSVKVRADIVWSALKIGRSSASSDRMVVYRLLGLVLIDVIRDGDN